MGACLKKDLPSDHTRHDQSRAVAESDILSENQRLEVFSLSRRFRYANFLSLQPKIYFFDRWLIFLHYINTLLQLSQNQNTCKHNFLFKNQTELFGPQKSTKIAGTHINKQVQYLLYFSFINRHWMVCVSSVKCFLEKFVDSRTFADIGISNEAHGDALWGGEKYCKYITLFTVNRIMFPCTGKYLVSIY